MIEPDQYRIDAGIDWKLQKYAAVYAEYQAELKKTMRWTSMICWYRP